MNERLPRKFFRSNYFPVKDERLFRDEFCARYRLRLIRTQAYPGSIGIEGAEGSGLEGYPGVHPDDRALLEGARRTSCLSSGYLRRRGRRLLGRSGRDSVPAFFAELAGHLVPGHNAIVVEMWYGTQEDDEGGVTGVAVAMNSRREWVVLDLDTISMLAQQELGGQTTSVEG